MLEAIHHRLYQEAFWAWTQQRDETDLRRNYMDKRVRGIQEAFTSRDRELARLLTKQLQSQVGLLQTAHCRAIYCTQSVGYTSRPCMRYNSRWEDSASITV